MRRSPQNISRKSKLIKSRRKVRRKSNPKVRRKSNPKVRRKSRSKSNPKVRRKSNKNKYSNMHGITEDLDRLSLVPSNIINAKGLSLQPSDINKKLEIEIDLTTERAQKFWFFFNTLPVDLQTKIIQIKLDFFARFHDVSGEVWPDFWKLYKKGDVDKQYELAREKYKDISDQFPLGGGFANEEFGDAIVDEYINANKDIRPGDIIFNSKDVSYYRPFEQFDVVGVILDGPNKNKKTAVSTVDFTGELSFNSPEEIEYFLNLEPVGQKLGKNYLLASKEIYKFGKEKLKFGS